MKTCDTILGAVGVSVLAGLASGAVLGGTVYLVAWAYASITFVVSALVGGFIVLLVAYPKYRSDL